MVHSLIVLFVAVVLAVVIPVRGQIDCSKPSPLIRNQRGFPECCEEVKWTQTALEKKCDSKPGSICNIDCHFREAKLIDPNGALNEANMKAILEEKLQLEPEYLPLAIKAANNCYSLAKQSAGNKQQDSCALTPAWTVDCLIRHLFVNCLPSKWKTSATCEAEKAFVQKCPVLIEM